VWGGIPDYLVLRLEKVQIEALRIITGLTVSCPTAKLYKESGYSPLQTRRKFHRLIMLYKIITGEAPSYLTQLVSPRVGENNRYNLRNQDDFTQIFCRTESFSKSFFPATIREWNQLPLDIRESQNLSTLRENLKPCYLYLNHENTRFSAIYYC
jgi:hypothetical protein